MAQNSASESQILDAVCEYLHMMGYFFFRVNNTGLYDPTKKTMRKLSKWSMKGVSDLMVVFNGTVYFIEVKSASGRQSPDQQAFQAMVESNDCDYFIVRSVDDIASIFRKRVV